MAKYQVGQKLWLNSTHGHREHGHEAEIKTVGRKWITLDNNLCFAAQRELPAPTSSYGWQVFESKGHADRYLRLRTNWSNFGMHLRNHPLPADMTTEKIIAAAELLGIDYEIVKGEEASNG